MCVLLKRTGSQGSEYYYLKSLDSRCCHSTQVIILFPNAKLSCLTARKHADETRRGGTSAARQYVEGDCR
jgi:hypothetical protein